MAHNDPPDNDAGEHRKAHGWPKTNPSSAAALSADRSKSELRQSAFRGNWMTEQPEERLATIMNDIHDSCATTADEYGASQNYILGANITGFVRFDETMRAPGVV